MNVTDSEARRTEDEQHSGIGTGADYSPPTIEIHPLVLVTRGGTINAADSGEPNTGFQQ